LLGGEHSRRAAHTGAADAAVAHRVLLQVLLVVGLGGVEGAVVGRQDLGGDGAVAGGGQDALEGAPGGLGGALLLGGVGVDRRPVLGADVVALSEALGGIVALPEETQQRLIGDLRGVVDDPDRLGVAGAAGADLLVAGI